MDQINRNRNASTIGAAQQFQRELSIQPTEQTIIQPTIETQVVKPTNLNEIKVTDQKLIDNFKLVEANDKELQDNLTAASLNFASGAGSPSQQIVAPETEVKDTVGTYNRHLYSDTIGVTRYDQIRNKVGLRADQSFTDWYYSNGGFVPEGFERDAQMLLKEERIKRFQKQMVDGEISELDFLYKAYGRDLMRMDGYDVTNPNYWYSKLSNGDYSDIFDNYTYMSNLYSRAQAAYQQELWYEERSLALQNSYLQYVGQKLDVQQVQELFPEQFAAMNETINDGQKLLDLYRAGSLDEFAPFIYGNDGKVKYYLHYDGRLYQVEDANKPGAGQGNIAAAHYDADGNLDRIRIRNANGVGEVFQNFVRGIGDFGTGLLEFPVLAGALLVDGLQVLGGDFELNTLSDTTTNINKWKNTWSWYSNDYVADRGLIGKDGQVNYQNLFNGLAYGVGLVGSMLITGGLGGSTKAAAVLAKETTETIVTNYADDIVLKLGAKTFNNVDDFIKGVAALPDTYLADDIVKAAAKKGLTVTDNIITQRATALNLTNVIGTARTNTKIAYDAGRGILGRGLDGATWMVKSLSGLRNGAPSVNMLNAAVSTQVLTAQSLLPLALRDFMQTAGVLKSRQKVNNLSDLDIVGFSLGMATVNYGISMVLRGTLNQGALDRHANWLKDSIQKNLTTGQLMTDALKQPGLRTGFINFINNMRTKNPLLLANVQSFMDVAENFLTMATNVTTESLYRDDNNYLKGLTVSDFGRHLGSLFNNPQTLAMNMYMHYSNMHGNMFAKLGGSDTESGMLTGELFNSMGSAKKIVEETIGQVRKIIAVEQLKGTDEGMANVRSLQEAINQVEKAIISDENNQLNGYVLAMDRLDDLTTKVNAATGEETSLLRETITKEVTKSRTNFIKRNVEVAAAQYNATLESFNKVQKGIWNTKLLRKLGDFYNNVFGDTRTIEAFKIFAKKEFSNNIDVVKEDVNFLNSINKEWEISNPTTKELFNQVTNADGLFNIITGTSDIKLENSETGEIISKSEPEFIEIKNKAKSVLDKVGYTLEEFTLVNIKKPAVDNPGSPTDQKPNDLGVSIRQAFDSIGRIYEDLIIKIDNDTYAVRSGDMYSSLLTQANIAAYIQNVYLAKYAVNESDIKNSLVNLIRIAGNKNSTPEIDAVLKSIPANYGNREEWYKETNSTLGKTNKEIVYEAVEKLVENTVEPGKGFKAGSELLILNALKVLDEDYLKNSKGFVGQIHKYLENIKTLAELQSEWNKFKKQKITPNQLNNFKTQFASANNGLKQLENINYLNYIKSSTLVDKNLDAAIASFGAALGELSPAQKYEIILGGLMDEYIVSNQDVDPSFYNIISEEFARVLAQYDSNIERIDTVDRTVKGVRKLKDIISEPSFNSISNAELIKKNDLLSLTKNNLVEVLKTQFNIADEKELQAISNNLITIKKETIKDLLGDSKSSRSNFKKNIESLYKQLLDSNTITEDKTKPVSFDDKVNSVFENYEFEELKDKIYDLNDYLRDALNIYTRVYDGTEEIVAKELIINLNELKPKTINKILKASNNKHKQEQLKYRSDKLTSSMDIIAILYNSDSSTEGKTALQFKIANEVRTLNNFKNSIGNLPAIAIKLGPNGEIPEFVSDLLVKFGYTKKSLSLLGSERIDGIYFNNTVARETLEDSNPRFYERILKAVDTLHKNKEKNLIIENKNTSINNEEDYYKNIEEILFAEVGGLEAVKEDTKIVNASNLVLSNFNPKLIKQNFLDESLINLATLIDIKIGISAGKTKNKYNVALVGSAIKQYANDIETDNIYFIHKVVDTAYNLIKEKAYDTVATYQLTDEEVKQFVDSGIYNVTKKAAGYQITIKGNEEDYLRNVSNYLNKNKNNIDINILTNYKLKDVALRETYETHFFAKLFASIDLEQDVKINLNNNFKNKSNLNNFDFDLTKEKTKTIETEFNGKTIKEINAQKSTNENNIYYRLIKNNVDAALKLSQVIEKFKQSEDLVVESKFIDSTVSRKAFALSLRKYYDSIKKGLTPEKARVDAFNEFKNSLDIKAEIIKAAQPVRGFINDSEFLPTYNAQNYRAAIENSLDSYNALTQEDYNKALNNLDVLFTKDKNNYIDGNELNYIQYNPAGEIYAAILNGSQDLDTSGFKVGIGALDLLNMSEDAYEEFKVIVKNINESVAKKLFDKYDSIRQLRKSNPLVIKNIATESFKQSGTNSDNKMQITTDADNDAQRALNIINNYKKEQTKLPMFKLSNANLAAENMNWNKALAELISTGYNEEINNKGSRLILDMTNKINVAKTLTNMTKFAKELSERLRGYDFNDPDLFKNKATFQKFANLAMKIYFYTSGLDYSNEYAKYLIVNDQGEIWNTANVNGSDFGKFKEVAQLISEFKQQEATIKQNRADGKEQKFFLLELNKDMINGTSGFSQVNPIKILELNENNINKFQGVVLDSILDIASRRLTSEELKEINTLTNEGDKRAQTIKLMYLKDISRLDAERLSKKSVVNLMRTINPNLDLREAEKIYNNIFNSLRRWQVDTPESTLTEEAILSSIDSSDLNELTRNYYTKNISDMLRYGFVKDSLPTELQSLLNSNKRYIINQVKDNIENTFINLGKTKNINPILKNIYNAINLISDSVNKNDLQQIDLNSRALKQLLLNNDISETNNPDAYKAIANDVLNYVLVNNNQPKHILPRLLNDPFKDMVDSLKQPDYTPIKVKTIIDDAGNQNQISATVDNVYNFNLYSSDVENIYLNKDYESLNKNSMLTFKISIVETKAKEGKTKDIAKDIYNKLSNYINEPTNENKNKALSELNYKVTNIIAPIYIYDGSKYVLIDTEEKLKTFTYDAKKPGYDFYTLYYSREQGIKNSFNEYFAKMSKLKQDGIIKEEYKTFIDVDNAVNNSLKEFNKINLDNNTFVLGFNNKHDIEQLTRYKNISNLNGINKVFLNSNNWIDTLSDGYKSLNFEGIEGLRKKSLEVLTGKKSAGGSHDSEYDSLATLFVFANLMQKKINSNNYRTEITNDFRNIINSMFDNPQEFVPQLKNIFAEFKDNNSDAAIKDLIESLNLKDIDELELLNELSREVVENIRDVMINNASNKRNEFDKTISEFKTIYNFQLNKLSNLSNRREKDNYAELKVYVPESFKTNIDIFHKAKNNINIATVLNYLNKAINHNTKTYNEINTEYENNPNLIIKDLKNVMSFINSGNLGDLEKNLDAIFSGDLKDIGQKISEIIRTPENYNNQYSKEELFVLTNEIKNNIKNIFNEVKTDEEVFEQTEDAKEINRFANILTNVIKNDEYNNIRTNQQREYVGYKFNQFIDNFANAFDIEKVFDNKGEGSLLKNITKNILKTFYTVGVDIDDIPQIRKSVYNTFNTYKHLYADFIDDPTSHFTIGRNGLYSQTTDINVGQKLEVLDGYKQANTYKTTTARADTLYVAEDIFRNHFRIDKNIPTGLALQAIRNKFNLSENDPLYVLTTRHPNVLGENQHVIRVEVLKANTFKNGTVAINKDIARAKYQMDFDGDDIVIYAPDEFVQDYGKRFNKYINGVYSIYNDMLSSLANTKLNFNNIYQQNKINIKNNLNKIFDNQRLISDYQKIVNSKYDDKVFNSLKQQAELDINKAINDLLIDNENKTELETYRDDYLKYFLKLLWFVKEDLNFKAAALNNPKAIYTINPNFNSKFSDRELLKTNRNNLQYAMSTKFLTFKEKMFADTASGEYRNMMNLTAKNVTTDDSLADIFNFQNFLVTDETRDLMEQNYKEFVNAFYNNIKDNKELISLINQDAYQDIINDIDNIRNNDKITPSQAIDNLIINLQFINNQITRNTNFKNEFAEFVLEMKENYKNTNAEKNKFLYQYLRSELTDEELNGRNINKIFDFYSNIGATKIVLNEIRNKNMKLFPTSIKDKEADQLVNRLVTQLIKDEDFEGNEIGKNSNDFSDYVMAKILVFPNNNKSYKINPDQFVVTNKGKTTFRYGAVYQERFKNLLDEETLKQYEGKVLTKDLSIQGKSFPKGIKINKIDYDNRTIFYTEIYGISGKSKLIALNSNIKGTPSSINATDTAEFLDQIDKNLKGKVDLITSESNIDGKEIGTYAGPLAKTTYYDANNNIVKAGKGNVSYYILEVPMKNAVYQESWNNEQRPQRIATLTANTSKETLASVFIQGSDNLNVKYIGDDEEGMPNYDININTELESAIANTFLDMKGSIFQQANGKTSYDLLRLIAIKNLTNTQMTTGKFNTYVKEIINQPEKANGLIFGIIKEYFKNISTFKDKLNKQSNGLYKAIFDIEIAELFLNEDGLKLVKESSAAIKGKGASAAKRLEAALDGLESLGRVHYEQVGPLAVQATSARQNENRNIIATTTEYYPKLAFMNKLMELAINEYNFQPTNKKDTNLYYKNAEDATLYGYAAKGKSYKGSAATGFNPIDYNFAKESKEVYKINSAKSGSEEVQQGLIRVARPTLVSTEANNLKGFNFDDYSKGKYFYDLADDLFKTNTGNEYLEKLNNKNLLYFISRAGNFKNIIDRYYAAGFGNDKVKVNEQFKVAKSTEYEPLILDIDQKITEVPIYEWQNVLDKNGFIDNYFTLLKNNEEPRALLEQAKQKRFSTANYEIEELSINVVDPKQLGLNKIEMEKYNNDIESLFKQVKEEKVYKGNQETAEEYSAKFRRYNNTFGDNTNMDKKLETDWLSSSRIAEKDAVSFETSQAIVDIRKDKYYNLHDMNQEIYDLYEVANKLGTVDRINKYMYIKSMLDINAERKARLAELKNEKGETYNVTPAKKAVEEITKLEAAIKLSEEKLGLTDEEAKRFLKSTEDRYSLLISKANDIIGYVQEQQKQYLKLNGAPIDNVYFMLTPSVPEGFDNSVYNYFRKNMFSRNFDILKDNKFSLMTYNFFDTMNDITKVIAEEKAYYNAARRFKESGMMENKTIIERVQNNINNILDEYYSREIEYSGPYKQEALTAIDTHLKNLISKFDDRELYAVQELVNDKRYKSRSNKLIMMYKELQNFVKLHGMSYNEAVAAIRTTPETNPNNKVYQKIIYAHEGIADTLAILTKTFNINLDFIYDDVKSYANSKGYELTDTFGRKIPEDPSKIKMLTPFNFEYAIKGLQYFSSYNGGQKTNAVLDMLAGDMFYTNKSLADYLDKYEFNKKVPNKFIKALRKVNAITTPLLMSSPFQLLSRIGKWTLGDIGFGLITDLRSPLKLPDAYKDLRAWVASKGKVQSEDIKDWLKFYPISPEETDFNLLVNDIDSAEKAGKLFDAKWFKTTAKIGSYQSMIVRFAMFKSIKESFEQGRPNYGSVYSKKNIIDNLKDVYQDGKLVQTAAGRKAGYIVNQTLGSVLDFPYLSRELNGLFVFTTYPSALLRWARNEFSSLSAIAKDLFIDSAGNKKEAFRNLATKGLGIAGIYGALALIYEIIGAIYNVDEEEKEEWREEQATPEFIKTLFQGSPVMDKFNSMNPFRQIQEKTIVPFQEGLEEGDNVIDGLAKGAFRFVLENFGNVNPLFKTTYEVISGNDIIERSVYPVSEYNDTFDNFYRKVAAYFIGGAGSRELMRYKNDLAPYQTDMNLVEKVLEGATRAIDAEFGNTKQYKGEQKNYYKAKEIINGYRFPEEAVETITKPNLPEQPYDIVRKEISRAMTEQAPQNKIYDIIIAYAQAGVDLKTIRSALRANSLDETISKIGNTEQVLSNLSEKELGIVQRALTFERTLYPWLNEYKELLDQLILKEDNNYTKRYYPNYYNRNRYYNIPKANINRPYLNLYRNKVYLKDPFKAYQAGYFELNPDKKRQMEE